MKYTTFQNKVLNYLGLAKVSYHKNMWSKNHQIGYVTPDKPYDKIHIAKDLPSDDIKEIALLHECGHIYFNHTSTNVKKELQFIKSEFERLKKPFSLIRVYGGPMSFLNIAMDLEVNTKLLTLGNVKTMNNFVKICTPDAYEIEVLDNFRDYYEPLINKLSDNDEEMEQLQQQISDLLDALDKMKDVISEGTQTFDKDFDNELQKELQKEGYNKSKQKNNSKEEGDESTVGDSMDTKNNGQEDGSSGSSSGNDSDNDTYGNEHSTGSAVKIEKNSSSVIKKFLNNIIKTSMNYQPDSMRHYIRGTRHNDSGILYTSLRRKAQMDKKKIGVLIDVSGSMYTDSVIKACKTLKESIGIISEDSVVCTWDTRLCEEFLVTKIPDCVCSGGGTDMNSGLQYLINKKNCDDVVIYSDFGTDIGSMIKTIKSNHVNVYSICTMDEGNWLMNDSEFNEYLKLNKRHIFVTND